MDNTKDDKNYIQRIKKDLEFIVVHMRNDDIEEINKKEAVASATASYHSTYSSSSSSLSSSS